MKRLAVVGLAVSCLVAQGEPQGSPANAGTSPFLLAGKSRQVIDFACLRQYELDCGFTVRSASPGPSASVVFANPAGRFEPHTLRLGVLPDGTVANPGRLAAYGACLAVILGKPRPDCVYDVYEAKDVKAYVDSEILRMQQSMARDHRRRQLALCRKILADASSCEEVVPAAD